MIRFGYIRHPLQFAFDAHTSRGAIKEHVAYLVHARNMHAPKITGWGEAAPLIGLSIDAVDHFEDALAAILDQLNHGAHREEVELNPFPAIRFALETAMLDLHNGGRMQLFDTPFLRAEPIDINGLVWMAGPEAMYQQALEKIKAGFSCIKFKVGAADFDAECRMIEKVRTQYNAFKIGIRLDANGAFNPSEAGEQLKELQRFDIHSIEQPIAAGQAESMHELCRKSKIPIALDEELIGINSSNAAALLKRITPAFIILKPTLLGGLGKADAWIAHAQRQGIGWWATSALESNIGLNAIAQWTASKAPGLPQGLGTGSLYTNNIPSPLTIYEGKLYYDAGKKWALPLV